MLHVCYPISTANRPSVLPSCSPPLSNCFFLTNFRASFTIAPTSPSRKQTVLYHTDDSANKSSMTLINVTHSLSQWCHGCPSMSTSIILTTFDSPHIEEETNHKENANTVQASSLPNGSSRIAKGVGKCCKDPSQKRRKMAQAHTWRTLTMRTCNKKTQVS